MGFWAAQMRALGKDDLPETVTLGDRTYTLREAFKHSFVTAVGAYANGADEIVCKFHRTAGFCGLPVGLIGRMAAAHEAGVIRRVQDLQGVPRLRERILVNGRAAGTAVVRDYIRGEPLRRGACVDDEFFPRLSALIVAIHERGVAYVDLEKASNVLVGEDGRPNLLDFQLSFWMSSEFLGRTALVRKLCKCFQSADIYHVRKHWRRVRPDQMSAEEVSGSRKRPWPVRLGNLAMIPFKIIRRLLFGRRKA